MVEVDLELAVEVGRDEVLVGDERVLALEVDDDEDLVVVAAAATPPTVVWTSRKQLVAVGRGVVTVLVKLRAFPSPFSKNPNTSKTAPSASCSSKS